MVSVEKQPKMFKYRNNDKEEKDYDERDIIGSDKLVLHHVWEMLKKKYNPRNKQTSSILLKITNLLFLTWFGPGRHMAHEN